MKLDAQRHLKRIFPLWFIPAAALFMTQAEALVLGEIQVQSPLGQPLQAQVAIVDSGNLDASQLETRLAGFEDYQRFGLQYPVGHRFRFQLVKEPGSATFIRVNSSLPIEDPFLNLLLEVSAPEGKLIKSYTLLLDPAPGLQTSAYKPVEIRQAEGLQYLAAADSAASTVPDSNSRLSHTKNTTHKAKSKRPLARKSIEIESVRWQSPSHMKLAMSLSISKYDPSASTKPDSDALQEDLIAKEKMLEDLHLQIDDLQKMIKTLESGRAVSSVGAAVVGTAVSAPLPVAPVKQLPEKAVNLLNAGLTLAALLLGLLAFLLYRKHQAKQAWQHGPFDDHEDALPVVDDNEETVMPHIKPEEPVVTMMFPTKAAPFSSLAGDSESEPLVVPVVPPLQFERVMVPYGGLIMPGESEQSIVKPSVGEQTTATAAYTEHAPVVPAEYLILMEANRHLRAGNDQLAEASLLRAIEVNPKNVYGYQALLKIYEARGDAKGFESILLQLKALDDASAWEEALVMGRKLDPHNPLYADK